MQKLMFQPLDYIYMSYAKQIKYAIKVHKNAKVKWAWALTVCYIVL